MRLVSQILVRGGVFVFLHFVIFLVGPVGGCAVCGLAPVSFYSFHISCGLTNVEAARCWTAKMYHSLDWTMILACIDSCELRLPCRR